MARSSRGPTLQSMFPRTGFITAAVFRLREHLERFHESAAAYNFEIPYSVAELTEAICGLIRVNELASCYIRPICFMGSSSLGVHPAKCPKEVAVMVWPWGAYLGSEGLEKGIRVTASPWRRPPRRAGNT